MTETRYYTFVCRRMTQRRCNGIGKPQNKELQKCNMVLCCYARGYSKIKANLTMPYKLSELRKMMKFLFFVLIFIGATFQMQAASYEDALFQVETWIQKKYPKNSLAKGSYEAKIKKIYESPANEEVKIQELHKIFPEAFEKNTDESLIVKPSVSWKVHSLAIGYDIKDSTTEEIKTVDIQKELEQKELIDETVQNDKTSKKRDKGYEGKISGSVKGIFIPLLITGKIEASISGHYEKSDSASSLSSSLWNKKQQALFLKNKEIIVSMLKHRNISNLHLTFTVTFYNKTKERLQLPYACSIPVYMGNKSCNKPALPYGVERIGNTLCIRPNNPQGQDVVFRMDLNTTTARELIEYMTHDAPVISLDRGTIGIFDQQGKDMISEKNRLPASTVVTLHIPQGRYVWNIKQKWNSFKDVTIREAVQALQKDFQNSGNNCFGFNEKGDLISVSEIPVGAFHQDDKECIYMVVAEHNGVFYDNLSSDFLEYKLGTNPFHIYVVDCLNLAAEDPLLLKVIFQAHLHAVTQIEKTFVQYSTLATRIGKFYHNGIGTDKNHTEAVKWWRKAAEQGYTKAQYNLGIAYANGEGVPEDRSEAVKWVRKAAEQGDANAQCLLGFYYILGKGVAKDMSEAVKWYRKAAEQGDATAQYELGWCYTNGLGVVKDMAEAVKWWRKAAEQGNADAQCFLGACYAEGEGVAKDMSEAVSWLHKAAEQGHAGAQYGLGWCYADEEGVVTNKAEAVKWWRKAAEQGYTKAQNNLGDCYYYGDGVIQDYAEAVKWYRKAAEQGNAEAQNNLGNCYYRNHGVIQDYVEAVKWYRKAAEQGNAEAQNNLGVCYANGEGVSKDMSEAVKWWRKAAEQGNVDAQYHIYQKASIERVLEQDKMLGQDDNKLRDVPIKMRAISTEGCPNDFLCAWEQHIKSWEKAGEIGIGGWTIVGGIGTLLLGGADCGALAAAGYGMDKINAMTNVSDTYKECLKVARKYGVNTKKYYSE